MRWQDVTLTDAPPIQRIATVNDLYEIRFSADGLAAVEVASALLDCLPLVGAERSGGPRLTALVELIRRRGFRSDDPIVCRIGMRGRWVLMDGGHRITALRILRRDWLARLFGPRIDTLYFLLFTTPDSWCKLRPPPGSVIDSANGSPARQNGAGAAPAASDG
ncbi:MAG: hypothetical protein AAF677_10990 [Pseudomonadota bacterium]